MESVKKIIHSNKDKYNNLSYYELLIEKIEKNIDYNPDITIESCKSLIEGISKFILEKIDDTYQPTEINKLEFCPLFNRLLDKIADRNDDFELAFAKKLSGLMHELGTIRNKRGDISHGRLSPKEQISSIQFAKLVKVISAGIVTYVLDSFLLIDLSYKDDVKYEDNIEFNKILDEANPLPSFLSYSKALFDQDITTYIDELDAYNLEN